MRGYVVLLSGHVGAGKSSLAELLRTEFGFETFKTSELLRAQLGRPDADRRTLQQLGRDLDNLTAGRWVIDALTRRLDLLVAREDVVVDAVRIPQQIDALRDAFGRRVFHIHLTATTTTLE